MVEYSPAVLDRVFAAVADSTRRKILTRLEVRPATVTEIARPFRMSLNAVSKHLKVLERAGLVERRILGREHVLGLRAERLRQAESWLQRYEKIWNARLDALGTFLLDRQESKIKPRGEQHGHTKRTARRHARHP